MGAVRGVAAVLAVMAAVTVSPSAAQDAKGDADGGAWSAERAFLELERLEAEVRTLRALAGAQGTLLAWNRERAESGWGPAVLPQALCGEPEIEPWCRTLTATFGAHAARTVPEAEREGDKP